MYRLTRGVAGNLPGATVAVPPGGLHGVRCSSNPNRVAASLEGSVIRSLLSPSSPNRRCSASDVRSVVAESSTSPASVSGSGAPAASCPLKGRFMLPALEVAQLMQASGQTMDQFLASLIKPASMLARPPVSGYHVGAAGVGSSGSVYVGVNLEFRGTGLNNSVHAEQFLVVNCLHHGEASLRMLAVSAAPCGHCRQFYSELVGSDDVAFIFGDDPRPRLLGELLPERFGPADLADDPFPLLLQPHDNWVSYSAPALRVLEQRNEDQELRTAAHEALVAAKTAYSPYTHCPSGAAIISSAGQVFSGGSIESAAYNPSLSPFHAAYINGVTKGLSGFSDIAEVVLAEVKGAKVSHRANVRALLRAVAPKAKFTVLPLRHDSPR
ncbi:hypothetical protein FOA52_007325 [Chlamydomonas sp. UWO 241]|nr:hypothetical protein FOA52_007325 [Chlamydomonas sp. UWO 241]